MALRSQFGRSIAQAMRTARRATNPSNTQAANGAVYRRPAASTSVTIAEIGIGRFDREEERDDDLVTADDDIVDFLIAVDDLVGIDGNDAGRPTPAERDEIEIAIQHDNGDPFADDPDGTVQTVVYRVLRTNRLEQAWRYTDVSRTTFRVHAKRVAESSEELAE